MQETFGPETDSVYSSISGVWETIILVQFDRPVERSSEKDCCRYWWLKFRQPERKSSSESSE